MPEQYRNQSGEWITLLDPVLFISLETKTVAAIKRDLASYLKENASHRLHAVENTLHAVNVELSRR